MLRRMDLAGLPPLAALLVAFAAGLASFLSPCVAPLLPGYVAFLAGTESGSDRRAALPRALGFVSGFVVLFAALGATAATLSRTLLAHRAELELVSGLVVALLGLAMVFDRSLVPAPLAARLQARSATLSTPATLFAAAPIGAAFAIAWSPCIGPALAAILTMAAGDARPVWGATLLVAYGLGLGLPFIAGAIAIDRVGAISRRLRRNAAGIRLGAGCLLVVLGVAIATGGFGHVTAQLAKVVPGWLA